MKANSKKEYAVWESQWNLNVQHCQHFEQTGFTGTNLQSLNEFGDRQLPRKSFSDFNVRFWLDLHWWFLLWTWPPNVYFCTCFSFISFLFLKEAYLFHWVMRMKNVEDHDANWYSARENIKQFTWKIKISICTAEN